MPENYYMALEVGGKIVEVGTQLHEFNFVGGDISAAHCPLATRDGMLVRPILLREDCVRAHLERAKVQSGGA